MKRLTTLSSLLLLGTTVGLLVKNWLAPGNLQIDLREEEYHLYL
ncbi:hypothetical protein [Pontibacter chitinilyticus]